MTEITILGVAMAIVLTIAALYRLIDRVFLRDEPPELDVSQERLERIDTLSARRALLLRELKDIEFDHDTNKIDDEDYKRLSRRYKRLWLEVDRELDSLVQIDDALFETVDAEIDERLDAAAVGQAGHAERRARRTDRRVCTHCGAANPVDAGRCFDCDEPLETAAPTPGAGARAVVTGALVLLACFFAVSPGNALAQGALPPGATAPSDAMHGGGARPQAPARVRVTDADKAGTATARIQVVRQLRPEADAPFGPAPAGVPVELQWRADRGQRLALSWSGKTDAAGRVDFGAIDLLRDTRRFELRAVVREGGVPHVSAPLTVQGGKIEGTVEMLQVTANAETVVGGSLVTIMGIPPQINRHPATYGYVQIQQVVELSVTGWQIYDTASARRAIDERGVTFEVPVKASSVTAQVMGGGGGETEVSDSTVRFKGTVYPRDERYPVTRLMVTYFLEADGSTLEFEQPMSMPFADIRLTFLRETDLPDHPLIDAEIVAPDFTEFADEATEGVMVGRKVKVARGLSLSRGDTLEFEVEGLPYPDDHLPWILAGIALLLVIGGVLLGRNELRQVRERRQLLATDAGAARADLDSRIEALFAGLTELERDFEAGEISAYAYDRERGRLRTRLAMLIQRRDGGSRAADVPADEPDDAPGDA